MALLFAMMCRFSIALERARQLAKDGKIGRYYAKRIDEIHSVNQYLVHDIAELE